MDLDARHVIQNRIVEQKFKRMSIRREIHEIDQQIRKKNEEIEALLNGRNRREFTGVCADSSDTLKRKWSVEDEGFGSASDCVVSAAKRSPGSPPAASGTGTGPSSPAPPPAIDLDSLLANLLSAGVIHKPVPPAPSQRPVETSKSHAKPVIPNLRNPKSLRTRNAVAIAALYNGAMGRENGQAFANPDATKSSETTSTAQYTTVSDWTRC